MSLLFAPATKFLHDDETFAEHSDIPVGTYPGLFNSVFDQAALCQWLGRKCHWQLRLLGPPGSGKTTLVSLLVELLKCKYEGTNTGIASIYFKDETRIDDDKLLVEIVSSIHKQLSNRAPDKQDPSCDLQVLRERLHAQLQGLERAFLIIDDLDACSQSFFNILEVELPVLQQYGLSVLATSRIPLHHDTTSWDCNIDPKEHRDVSVFWCCKDCSPEGSNQRFIVCQECYDDNDICEKCQSNDAMYEPYAHVNIILKGVLANDDIAFSEFVGGALEAAHGDLGLNSEMPKKPPHSALGRVLTNNEALQTVNIVCEEAESNVTMAKLQLDLYQEAQTRTEIEKVGDRLPDNILALFDAAIARIMRKPEIESQLGLHALVAAVVGEENETLGFAQRFATLSGRLQKWGLLDNSEDQTDHHNLNRVLRATCGYLWVQNDKNMSTEPYHHLFKLYIAENYHDELYKTRARMVAFNRLGHL